VAAAAGIIVLYAPARRIMGFEASKTGDADGEFKLSDALGQRRVPATLVLDRGGRVVYSGGALDEQALAAFRAALGGA